MAEAVDGKQCGAGEIAGGLLLFGGVAAGAFFARRWNGVISSLGLLGVGATSLVVVGVTDGEKGRKASAICAATIGAALVGLACADGWKGIQTIREALPERNLRAIGNGTWGVLTGAGVSIPIGVSFMRHGADLWREKSVAVLRHAVARDVIRLFGGAEDVSLEAIGRRLQVVQRLGDEIGDGHGYLLDEGNLGVFCEEAPQAVRHAFALRVVRPDVMSDADLKRIILGTDEDVMPMQWVCEQLDAAGRLGVLSDMLRGVAGTEALSEESLENFPTRFRTFEAEAGRLCDAIEDPDNEQDHSAELEAKLAEYSRFEEVMQAVTGYRGGRAGRDAWTRLNTNAVQERVDGQLWTRAESAGQQRQQLAQRWREWTVDILNIENFMQKYGELKAIGIPIDGEILLQKFSRDEVLQLARGLGFEGHQIIVADVIARLESFYEQKLAGDYPVLGNFNARMETLKTRLNRRAALNALDPVFPEAQRGKLRVALRLAGDADDGAILERLWEIKLKTQEHIDEAGLLAVDDDVKTDREAYADAVAGKIREYWEGNDAFEASLQLYNCYPQCFHAFEVPEGDNDSFCAKLCELGLWRPQDLEEADLMEIADVRAAKAKIAAWKATREAGGAEPARAPAPAVDEPEVEEEAGLSRIDRAGELAGKAYGVALQVLFVSFIGVLSTDLAKRYPLYFGPGVAVGALAGGVSQQQHAIAAQAIRELGVNDPNEERVERVAQEVLHAGAGGLVQQAADGLSTSNPLTRSMALGLTGLVVGLVSRWGFIGAVGGGLCIGGFVGELAGKGLTRAGAHRRPAIRVAVAFRNGSGEGLGPVALAALANVRERAPQLGLAMPADWDIAPEAIEF